MSTSHFFHSRPSDEFKAEVDREHGDLRLSIHLDGSATNLHITLTEEKLATLTEVLTEDQDTRPIPCGTCDGGKVIIVGWEPDFGNEQGDEIEGRCPVCEGNGSIANGVFVEEYGSGWPDEDFARVMFKDQAETMQLSKGEQ